MRLENSFTVPREPARVWPLLLDIPVIAPCLPGTELTEVVGKGTYKGRARVRIGPMLLTFAGTAEIVEIDAASGRARLRAKGADEKGRGAAEAEVVFDVIGEGGETQVNVVTDLNLVGAVAQYGRATGLIQGIAAEITRDFARNFEALIREAGDDAPAPAPARPLGGLALLWRAVTASLRRWLGAVLQRGARGRENDRGTTGKGADSHK